MKQILNGTLVKDYLIREGRKLGWVAAQIGVSESVISRMVRGHVPKMDTVKRLSELLGVKVKQLLKNDDKAA